VSYVAIPLLGAAADLWLLTQLDNKAITLGLSWLVLGIVYLGVMTKGFRTPPPEMEFTEEPALEPAVVSAVD
jgi:hypothetical protein